MRLFLFPAPNQRTTRGPALLVGAYALAWGLLLPWLPAARIQAALAIAILLPNLLGPILFLLRARGYPDERRGWLILAGSTPAALLSVALLGTAGPLQSQQHPMGAYLAAELVAGLMQAWAVLAWPWRSPRSSARFPDLLGSLLFGSSVFLLLWVLGLWQASLQGRTVIHAILLAFACRFAILSGVIIYFFSQDPRRVLGPLGWMLAATAARCLVVGFLQPLLAPAGVLGGISPWWGLATLGPGLFALAAWSPRPVEVPRDQAPLRFPFAVAVPYLPFLLAGGFLGMTLVKSRAPMLGPLLTFMAITGVLVLRQFLLLQEVKNANTRLEERVAQRTLALERIQSLMLRTERMNSMAILGAGLAHDLNNLLGVASGTAELMKMDLEENQATDPMNLKRIEETLDKAGGLTHRLMAFARKESLVERVTTTDLADSLRASRDILTMILPQGITLTLEIQPLGKTPPVDPATLEQVLVNLVSNARDAMDGPGEITIALRRGSLPGGRPAALLEVHNTGSEIPLELQDVIFEPFYTTKPEGKGTGLGLPFVRSMMTAQGGTIEVESAPGQGVTFRLAFPQEG